jgi:hypothetical protein
MAAMISLVAALFALIIVGTIRYRQLSRYDIYVGEFLTGVSRLLAEALPEIHENLVSRGDRWHFGIERPDVISLRGKARMYYDRLCGGWQNRSRMVRWLLLLLTVIVAGCDSSDEGRLAAEEGVKHFHAMLNDEKYVDIYQATSPKLKEVTSEGEMIGLLKTVHIKLGNVSSSKTSQGRTVSHLMGTEIVLIQNTEFESGGATETFTFTYQNKKLWLVGYKVDSPDIKDD